MLDSLGPSTKYPALGKIEWRLGQMDVVGDVELCRPTKSLV